ncbi:MAG TPA: outer membrane beta-barrel protein [Gemmatimonadales bacterium]|nr:outer membrane beta-barrel protein [Gemmatimonadales bacterium]
MRKLLGSALLLAVVALAPTQAAAQRRAAARPAASSAQKTSFGLELDVGTTTDFGIGGRAVFPLQSLFPGTPLDGIVSFDYYFPSAPSGVTNHFWEINGNLAYRLRVPARSSFRPYLGGGLNIAHSSGSAGGISASSTDADLNILGGTTFKVRGSLIPFLEIRGVVGNANQVVFTGGVRF